jgi:hypothetical protein
MPILEERQAEGFRVESPDRREFEPEISPPDPPPTSTPQPGDPPYSPPLHDPPPEEPAPNPSTPMEPEAGYRCGVD